MRKRFGVEKKVIHKIFSYDAKLGKIKEPLNEKIFLVGILFFDRRHKAKCRFFNFCSMRS